MGQEGWCSPLCPSAPCPASGVVSASFTNSHMQEPAHRQFTVLGKVNWEWTVWTLFELFFDCMEEHKTRNAWEECYNALLKPVKACRGLCCLPQRLWPPPRYYRECCLYPYLNRFWTFLVRFISKYYHYFVLLHTRNSLHYILYLIFMYMKGYWF